MSRDGHGRPERQPISPERSPSSFLPPSESEAELQPKFTQTLPPTIIIVFCLVMSVPTKSHKVGPSVPQNQEALVSM